MKRENMLKRWGWVGIRIFIWLMNVGLAVSTATEHRWWLAGMEIGCVAIMTPMVVSTWKRVSKNN